MVNVPQIGYNAASYTVDLYSEDLEIRIEFSHRLELGAR